MSRPSTNPFALLDEPRRPWIDPGRLKQKFLELSAEVHPDRVHNTPEPERQAADRRYAELNTAYNSLREPKERLRHLLELEQGGRPPDVQLPPPGMMDTAFEIGRLCQEADVFLVESAKVTAPLLKISLFERAQDYTTKLMALRTAITGRREALLAELESLNPAWESARLAGPDAAELPLARLEQIYRLLGYFDRWSQQIQERIVQLSL